MPFQDWRHFKEAYAPELVARAVASSRVPVRRCLDPFGGSGTTALACQFLGLHPVTIEVNPFLADLIESKLATYDPDALAGDLGAVIRSARDRTIDPKCVVANLPGTFIEPGVAGKWIFDTAIAARIAVLREAVQALPDDSHRRLFRVLLGGVLVEASNIVVSGKGRRYRGGWQRRTMEPQHVDNLFCKAARRAIAEIHRFRHRPCATYEVYRGDCRTVLAGAATCELAVFSPPYPNSFDYTDVYNVELWMLGYLANAEDNRSLRQSTLCSHVQIARQFPIAPSGSPSLDRSLEELLAVRACLWSRWIPDMVGGYFADLAAVLDQIWGCLPAAGSVWMVLGDSRYAGVQVKTAEITSEIAVSAGWELVSIEPFRSMRASPQQGGRPELAESLVVLTKSC